MKDYFARKRHAVLVFLLRALCVLCGLCVNSFFLLYPKTSATNPATCSAIAGAAVNPGDSIPTN